MTYIKGSALITALFIMALIAAAATAMIVEQQIAITSANQAFNYTEALEYSQMITDWAIDSLDEDVKANRPIFDKIPQLYPTQKLANGEYRGVLLDLQSKFNLNNLRDKKSWPGFANMLKAILPSESDPKTLTQAIANWVSPKGALDLSFDDAYRKAKLPYSPPHRLMMNISELREVIGVTASVYRALIPYVTVLPKQNTLLNINNASAIALLSASPSLSLSSADAIIQNRPYLSDASVATNPVIKNHGLGVKDFTRKSHFFQVRSLVQINQQTLLTHANLYRDPNSTQVTVLWQTQGDA